MISYPRERKFRSYGGYSSRLMDVVVPLPNPELRKDFRYDRWTATLETPFRNAEVVPHHEVQLDFLCVPFPLCPKYETFEKGYMASLAAAITDKWNPDKIHVIATSSGYDSRCIAMAIKTLAEENGDEWLGRVLFFEAAGEPESFTQLMRAQGWAEDQYLVCYGGKPTEYHRYSFDFGKAWQRLNGFVSYPVNVWYTPIEWMQEQGILPNDDSQIQFFTMYGANETTKACKRSDQGLEYYYWWHYHHMLSAFPLKAECIHPCYHPYVLKYLGANREPLQQMPDGTSVCAMVSTKLYPEFNGIKKLVTKDVQMAGYLNPSRSIMEMVERNYRSSWYGREVHPEIKPAYDIEYRDWWGHWATASFCEHLKNQGRSISVV